MNEVAFSDTPGTFTVGQHKTQELHLSYHKLTVMCNAILCLMLHQFFIEIWSALNSSVTVLKLFLWALW